MCHDEYVSFVESFYGSRNGGFFHKDMECTASHGTVSFCVTTDTKHSPAVLTAFNGQTLPMVAVCYLKETHDISL